MKQVPVPVVLPAGIENSKLHYRTGHYKIPGLFATSFHLMMEQIQAFIIERGRSFEEYQEAKRKKIEAFLKGEYEVSLQRAF